ncbi:hypothetical protein [Alkalilacustris brevis]|uniref:hypothetical protein n=1 Tax=Alkalilacustris brevis TaxID=2026338 RepID=UPI000E0D20F8|nr:hypothetical protein [Alkalilacustris brevis]
MPLTELFANALRHASITVALLSAGWVASPVVADPPGRMLDGAEFEALTTGRTMTYGVGGLVYGIEQYLPGRRVIWAFAGDACRQGTWFEADDHICFVYDDAPERLHCWQFFDTDAGLRAQAEGDPPGSGLVEVGHAEGPMECPGLWLGS